MQLTYVNHVHSFYLAGIPKMFGFWLYSPIVFILAEDYDKKKWFDK